MGDGDGDFAECPMRHSAKEFTLPSVCLTTLDKESTRRVPPVRYFAECLFMALGKACFFAECQSHYTRQRTCTGAQVLVLCRVLRLWHSAKRPVCTFFICFPYSIQTNKRYFTDITYIHHRSSQTYIANTNSINTNSDISIQHKLRGSQHKQY
jgi:hypothetical protein